MDNLNKMDLINTSMMYSPSNVYIKLRTDSELGKALKKLTDKYNGGYIKKKFLGQVGKGNGKIIQGIIDSSRRITAITWATFYKKLREKENYTVPISVWVKDIDSATYCGKDVEISWLEAYLEAYV